MNLDEVITSQWFQGQAKYRVDSERHLARLEGLRPGEIIYSRGWEQFFRRYHSQIPVPYVLISNFHDRAIDTIPEAVNDSNLLHWFGVNMAVEHPKMTPIPLAIDKRTLPLMKNTIRRNGNRNGTLINFSLSTQERKELYLAYSGNEEYIALPHDKRNAVDYFRDLGLVEFVLCPKGNGHDTYRVWEALAMGATPIVKSSFLDRLYRQFPITIVKSWDDVPAVTNTSLERMSQTYWAEKLRSYGTS